MKFTNLILISLLASIGLAQSPCSDYCLSFDDTLCISQLTIDTIAFPENIWQTGLPQKSGFNEAAHINRPNAMITDTLHAYPANNTSVFYIANLIDEGYYYGLKSFTAAYNVQTDSLHDQGNIEFSVDQGVSWINMIHDTVYNSSFIWWGNKPVLTGNSNGWHYFELILADLGSLFDIQLGDTIIYKFTFTSDSIFDDLGGIMFDDICFYSFVEGVTETRFKPLKSSIYPNPSNDLFTIEFENSQSLVFNLAVYNSQSKLMFNLNNITAGQVSFDAKKLMPGIYFYKLTNPVSLTRSWGKFVVSK